VLPVPTGGKVLETFLETMSGPKSHKTWCDHLKSVEEHGIHVMEPAIFKPLVKREKGKWHGFVLLATANIKPKSRKQSFLVTFSARYHGLSRMGIRVLGYCGMLMKLSQYDTWELKQLKENRDNLRCADHSFTIHAHIT